MYVLITRSYSTIRVQNIPNILCFANVPTYYIVVQFYNVISICTLDFVDTPIWLYLFVCINILHSRITTWVHIKNASAYLARASFKPTQGNFLSVRNATAFPIFCVHRDKF